MGNKTIARKLVASFLCLALATAHIPAAMAAASQNSAANGGQGSSFSGVVVLPELGTNLGGESVSTSFSRDNFVTSSDAAYDAATAVEMPPGPKAAENSSVAMAVGEPSPVYLDIVGAVHSMTSHGSAPGEVAVPAGGQPAPVVTHSIGQDETPGEEGSRTPPVRDSLGIISQTIPSGGPSPEFDHSIKDETNKNDADTDTVQVEAPSQSRLGNMLSRPVRVAASILLTAASIASIGAGPAAKLARKAADQPAANSGAPASSWVPAMIAASVAAVVLAAAPFVARPVARLIRSGYEAVRAQIDMRRKDKVLARWQAAEDQGRPRTLIIDSSISTEHETGMVGESLYCLRLLIKILEASDPSLRIIYVSAMSAEKSFVRNHILRHKTDSEADEILKRVDFVSLDDDRARADDGGRLFLTKKLLEERHADKLAKIKRLIGDPSVRPAKILSYLSTKYEKELARRLGIPNAVNGPDPYLDYLGTKEWGRKIAKRAGVRIARGREGIRDLKTLVRQINSLREEIPGMKSVAIKLNRGISGGGNIYPELPENWAGMSFRQQMEFIGNLLREKKVGPKSFLELIEDGVVIEEDLSEAFKTASFPSVQMDVRILANGEVEVQRMATHEQRIVDGNVFEGAEFPANDRYRQRMEDEAYKIAKEYARRGVRGWIAMDFAVVPKEGGEDDLYFMEANIRLSGTTHIYFAALLAMLARYLKGEGKMRTADGSEVRYKSNDHYVSEYWKSVDARPPFSVAQLVQYSNDLANGGILDYDDVEDNVRITVFFHLLVFPSGNAGYTVIGRGKNKHVSSAAIDRAIDRAESRLKRALGKAESMHAANNPATFDPYENLVVHYGAFGAAVVYSFVQFSDDIFPTVRRNDIWRRLVAEFKRAHPDLLYDPSKNQWAGVVIHPRGNGVTVFGMDTYEIEEVRSRLAALSRDFFSSNDPGANNNANMGAAGQVLEVVGRR